MEICGGYSEYFWREGVHHSFVAKQWSRVSSAHNIGLLPEWEESEWEERASERRVSARRVRVGERCGAQNSTWTLHIPTVFKLKFKTSDGYFTQNLTGTVFLIYRKVHIWHASMPARSRLGVIPANSLFMFAEWGLHGTVHHVFPLPSHHSPFSPLPPPFLSPPRIASSLPTTPPPLPCPSTTPMPPSSPSLSLHSQPTSRGKLTCGETWLFHFRVRV